jgi:hypothetical protein
VRLSFLVDFFIAFLAVSRQGKQSNSQLATRLQIIAKNHDHDHEIKNQGATEKFCFESDVYLADGH